MSIFEPIVAALRSVDRVLGHCAHLLIFAYRTVLSPLIGPACRFAPTCSAYADEAIQRYGALRGGFMALRRLLRCHPLTAGGFDPVA